MECNNEAQFSEQHEFCNYLGLTELATANAVATAMRELANSNVARRSLRVRTQQQLDRMRSDVRGKRRERQQQQQNQQQREQQPQEKIGHRLNSDSNSSSNNSNVSSAKKTALSGNSAVPAASSSFVYPRPSAMNPDPVSPPTIEYYYHAQCGEQQNQQSNSLMVASDFHTMSLEAAFAKVYAAAAPAQNELHECMQSRLRQARETKPSIYIVKSLNNEPAPTIVPGRHSLTHASPERLQYNKKPEQAGAAKLSRKSPKKLSPKASKRRRTTVGVASATAPHERELVTRSTTHMNSKLLRNRKVNLLKSYELSDAMAHGRGKQRLSGGSAPANKRLNTPKVVKKSLKKLPTPTEQVVISHASSQQHRSDQQQPSPKPKKLRTQPEEQKVTVKRKRLRAKSLPTALNIQQKQPTGVGDTNMVTVKPDLNPNQQQQAKLLMDTQEFITNHAVVCPPLYNAAVRRYVNAVCNPKEHQSPEQQQQMQQQQQQQSQSQPQLPEGFYDMSLSYAQLAKPSLMYPPLSPPPSQRAPHFSRRARQVAGTSDVDEPPVPNIQITPPGGLLSLTKGSTVLRNPLAGKNGKVLYIYYELDQLIVLQEKLVSFWKYSKVFNVLQKATTEDNNATATQQHAFNIFGTNPNQNTKRDSADSDKSDESNNQRWIYLGGTRRITNGQY